MQQFKKLNLIGGILVGIFATIIYTLTMEATASLWDCGEFIAASYKLQVVHPPGAPNFLMIARMFTLMAFGDPAMVATTLNFMSALCSGMSMMFLFWITTYMGRKIMIKTSEDWTNPTAFAILGAGLVAGLTGTFLDSVWFSATEAEVYSMSLLFTSVVFWLMCKWESIADEPHADRYLLFIAFLMGISIFVHWLNLLSIPALGLIYYFRRTEKPKLIGILGALLLSVILLLFFLNGFNNNAILFINPLAIIIGYLIFSKNVNTKDFIKVIILALLSPIIIVIYFPGIITGIIDIASIFELIFVNDFGLPFNSGLIFYFSIFIIGFLCALVYFRKKGWALMHNLLLAYLFILIGYSTITTVVIRSNSGPYIDMNSPRDIVSLASYLHRDQYGSRPIFFGHYFTDKPRDIKYTGERYAKGKEKYDIVGERFEYDYGSNEKFFARMYDSKHTARYLYWLNIPQEKQKRFRPSLSDNVYFFFVYQINYMYVRYFLWNFVGRQNDEQGTGDSENGNWLGGIPFVDNMLNARLAPQGNLPDIEKNHPARNTYFYIPLLLGILGLVFHFMRDKKTFVILLFLFLLTGVALILYGNSPPIEPRERDYIFAASFYTFAVWVGLGALSIYHSVRKMGMGGVGLAVAIGLIAPAIMGFQNWDDHDRSGRTAAVNFASNYLNSVAPNAILFTQGDNDTYPLWYAQQVEGVRPDVRIVNLSLLGVDWYIAQCRRIMDGCPPVDFTLPQEKIRGSLRDQTLFQRNPQIAPEDRFVKLEDLIKFIGDDSRMLSYAKDKVAYYPTQKMSIPVNVNDLVANNILTPTQAAEAVPEMQWINPKESLLKHDLMVLDIINANAINGWKKPIYFAVSVERKAYQGLEKYFHQEGLAYRLLPIPAQKADPQSPFAGEINEDVMKENMLNKFTFGNLNEEGTFPGTDISRMVINMRSNFTRLADKLTAEGRKAEAIEVLDHCQEVLPPTNIPYTIYSFPMVLSYFDAGDAKKGAELGEQIAEYLIQKVAYFDSVPARKAKKFAREKELYKAYINQFIREAEQKGQSETVNKLNELKSQYNVK